MRLQSGSRLLGGTQELWNRCVACMIGILLFGPYWQAQVLRIHLARSLDGVRVRLSSVSQLLRLAGLEKRKR